jgi:hypothetical protein
MRPHPVFEPSGAPILPARHVRDHVLARVGARRPDLDPMDARLLAEAETGAGRIIDSPAELEPQRADPYADLNEAQDRDKDFIPDAVEIALGSNPEKSDAHLPAPGSPYSVIELYAHSLTTGD